MMLIPDLARAKAHHILLQTEAQAVDLMAYIHDLASFEQVAKTYSLCPSAKIGGDLGLTKPGVVVEALEQAIFSVPLHTVSGPIQTCHGYHLLWVKKRQVP